MSGVEFRDNSGRSKLCAPVTCLSCGVDLNSLPTYAVSRAGPGFIYQCVDCGTDLERRLAESAKSMAGQMRAGELHMRLREHLMGCGKLGILQLATAAFGPDDRVVAGLRDDLIANGTLPPDADVLRMEHDRLPKGGGR